MNESQFKSMFMSSFNPDPIHEAICERLREYYNVTPDSVDNKEAAKHYRKFSDWCKNNGFTTEQISSAKKDGRFKDI